jgi:methionyl aminopeptidase
MFQNKPTIKTEVELNIMKEGGKILAEIVNLLAKEVKEGNSAVEVDNYANFLCKRFKVKPAFLGYHGFTGTICANLNEVVVHGKPTTVNQKFKSGDIFGLDMGIIHYGLYLDMSVTVEIGEVDKEVKEFLKKTYDSMMNGIKAAKIGNTAGDISFAMREGLLSENFSLMRDFVGHGIGRNLHEAPNIPGVGLEKGTGEKLVQGMAVAIESISVMGPTNEYETDKDGWTVYTKGKKYLSGLYEHTVLITEEGPEIITINN